MSLTSLLENKKVQALFEEYFIKPRFTINSELLAPWRTDNYNIVGTAFDYLLRLMIEKTYPIAKAFPLVSEDAALLLWKNQEVGQYYNTIEKSIKNARNEFKKYGKTRKITDSLITSCLHLSYIDQIYRKGTGEDIVDFVIERITNPVDNEDIADLHTLSKHVNLDLFRPVHTCLLNPRFGLWGMRIGGADADLLIDDMVIDIKTTKNPRISRKDFYQVIGYAALAELCRRSDSSCDNFKIRPIRRVGVYFSRFAFLYTVAIETTLKCETDKAEDLLSKWSTFLIKFSKWQMKGWNG